MALGTRSPGIGVTGTRSAAPPPAAAPDFEEISLVDIVRVLYRRKIVFLLTVVLALVAGAALTVFTAREYESEAVVIPLEHTDIIKGWLESRQAAEYAEAAVGPDLRAVMYPDDWDAQAGTWRGAARSDADVAQDLTDHIDITGGITTGTNRNPALRLTITLNDAQVAQRVAQAYIDSLATLRPQLENITRSDLFDQYYDGTNAQEAQARAERAARENSYWIVFDSPAIPEDPVRPRPVLNMALAGVLGVILAVFVVFGLEWLSKYRGEFERVEPPR